MLKINVSGINETAAYLEALAKGELRFGIAKGLTSLANGIREKVKEELPHRFTLRTRWWDRGPHSIKTEKATKQNLTSKVFTTAPWMQMQEEGGTKLPTKSRRLALPMADVRRTKRDLVQKSQKPRALTKAFLVHTKTGHDFLAVRIGRGKRSTMKLMWLLERSVNIKKRFGFHETAQLVVDRVGLTHIEEGIKYALETSKR
ncbi:MAG: hypothetical protein HGB32_15375 [Geobacteraceae bacterium]|nr:hypothetical protein [Geobacteraceae bacterium]NTW81504.1 hypothetical protein [Geobacteraceae bacterium]